MCESEEDRQTAPTARQTVFVRALDVTIETQRTSPAPLDSIAKSIG